MDEQGRQEKARAAAGVCLVLMDEIVSEAASLTKAAARCAEDGNMAAGLQIAFDVEPRLVEANRLLQAASILRRRAGS